MRTTFCLGTLVVVTMMLSPRAFAEERSPNIQDDHRMPDIGEVVAATQVNALSGDISQEDTPMTRDEVRVAEVPKVIQTDLYEKAVQFALKIYPGIDEKALREKCAQGFMRDRYSIHAIRKRPSVSCRKSPSIRLFFPNGDKMELWAENAPPGITLDKLEKPLKLKDAEQLVRHVLSRLLPSPKDVAHFTITRSGEAASSDYCYFVWREDKLEPFRKAGKSLRIEVRKSDGLIQHVRVQEALPAPKIRFEDVAKTAAEAIQGSNAENRFSAKHVYLTQTFHIGMGRLVWRYAVPPKPEGWYEDVSMWDAMTGELLYSEVSNGGKPGKPYRNPAFYTELTEEIKQRNVEELIERRIADLQEQ